MVIEETSATGDPGTAPGGGGRPASSGSEASKGAELAEDRTPVICPACDHHFKAHAGEVGHPLGETTEFRMVTPGGTPLLIATCPSCGYSDWIGNLPREASGADDSAREPEEPMHVPDEVRQLLEDFVESHGAPETWDPTTRNEVAARIASLAGRPNAARAQFQLWVAWSAEDAGNLERAAHWRGEAAESLLRSLESGELAPEDRLPVIYLVGEILRRSGDSGRAGEWFQKVRSEADIRDPHARRLARLAEIQTKEPFDVLPGWF